jgi:hypothetical protein
MALPWDGADRIDVGERPREPLQDDDADAVAADKAVGLRVAELAAAVGGHGPRAA